MEGESHAVGLSAPEMDWTVVSPRPPPFFLLPAQTLS